MIRDARGDMPQAELGDLMSRPGSVIPQTTISRWERGLVDMTLEHLYHLEVALQLPYGTLARRAGYVEESSSQMGNLEEIVLGHPSIHPDYRANVAQSVRAWVKVSRKLTLETGRRVRFADGDVPTSVG